MGAGSASKNRPSRSKSVASKAAMLAPSSRPTRCRRSGSRAVRITSAPSSRARRAVSNPMPALPPITTTVCPSSSGAWRPGAIVDSAVIVPPLVKLGPVSDLAASARRAPPRPCLGVEAVVAAAGVVEDLARVDILSDELVARRLDVGDDKVEKPSRAGGRRGDARAEDDRARGARGCELEHSSVTLPDFRVQPPPEPPVELRRASDIRDGDDDDLELHVDLPD